MKKIYMILAALSLLTMSLNAQRLPAKNLGDFSFNPTGKASQKAPNGQFRMPSLGSGEYLLGPYTTDDFDATGISYGGYYSSGQSVAVMVELTREEFESHIGDTIIGFRFALAGSTATPVFDFMAWPASENYWDVDHRHTWDLGQLMSGNTNVVGEETFTESTVTFNQASDYGSTSITKNGVTISTTSGNLAQSYSQYRLYAGSNTTFSVTSGNITKIVFTPSNGYNTSSLLTPSTGSISSNTWTGNASSVVFTASSQYRCTNIVVTVETPSSTNTYMVDVGRGATKYEHLPVSGYNQDYGYHNQMIYRAGQLCMASGAVINSITFYPEEGIGLPFAGGTVTVKLGNTTQDNFGTGTTGTMLTGLTTVATITPVEDHDATAWKIDFATPFTYTGNNLVVDFSCTGNGTQYAHTNFLGDNQSANVSLVRNGNGTATATTGAPNTFLPKATFAFTGSVNTPNYLTLAGGEWHDFFLDQPVVLELGDSIQMLAIGYEYYQYTGTSHAPTAVNSNSTGHQHRSFMATDSYSARWWNDGVSGPDNTDRPGDLAVQLIFKSQMEQTPAPTITYTYDNGYYYVTATAPTSDPQAVVTLEVNGTTVSGTGQVQIPIGRGDTDRTVTATATAQADGKTASNPVTQEITILASPLDPTPAPGISSQVHDLTVEVNGSGQGEVHMYVDGREVPTTYYLERGTEDYYVTVTVTAQIQDTQHSMSTTTQQVLVPKLDNLDELISGWTELPGTYTNDKVINWNDNLMFIDRFTASTADNNHAPKYIYKMTEDNIKLIGEPRSTNEHIIPVMKTGSQVSGLYSYRDIMSDTLRTLPMQVLNADIEMYLEHSNDIYYYTLDRATNSKTNFVELSNLQNRRDDYYTEMDHNYTYGENIHYGTVFRDDTIGGIVDLATWGTDYMAYVPIVWTMGNDVSNTRANWENDHLHNSYGSPIWQNSVGQVQINSCALERQQGKYGSTNWIDNNGDSCSLYMLQVDAFGYLPAENVNNVPYLPFMFRVFVESPSGKLRGYSQVLEPGIDPENTGEPGSHLVYNPEVDHNLLCVYQELVDPSQTLEYYHLSKPKSSTWEDNIRFGGLNSIKAGDVNVYVRFYYLTSAAMPHGNMIGMSGPGGGGAEGSGAPGDPQTGISELAAGHGEVVGQTYYNAQGMQSDRPFSGINIVVTRYSDGTTRTTKVIR